MATAEQIAWVRDVLGVDISRAGRSRHGRAVRGDGAEAFGLPGIPDLPDLPDPGIKVHVTISNQSRHALEQVAGSAVLENPKGSGFDTPPPRSIEPKGSATVVVSNNFPFTTGVGGSVTYGLADEPGTTVFMAWERGRVPKRKAIMAVRPDDPARFEHDQGFDGDAFTFTFKSKGGGPDPAPPGPATGAGVSCLVTVTNNTAAVLTLAEQGHDRGDFMTFPAVTVPPGGSTSFASVQTPRGTPDQQGCAGFVAWQVGSPPTCTWRCEWDNPVGEKNAAAAALDPQEAGFSSLEQVGQGEENVPVAFILSGGEAPTPAPPGPEPAFEPPVEAKQPTLRRGDTSEDGWVEYLQEMLDLPVTAVFDDATLKAVIAFQGANGCVVDGIVGNETWSALRRGPRETPSTDGRAPHSFVEHGVEARWFVEDPQALYDDAADSFLLPVESVGDDADISAHEATVRVTPPGTQPKVVKVPIGPPTRTSPTGHGNIHVVALRPFRQAFPSADPNAPVEGYVVEAYLDAELGGDFWKGSAAPG